MSFSRSFDVLSERKTGLGTRVFQILSRTSLLMLAFFCLSYGADAVFGQVRVTAIWKEGQSLKSSDEVTCRHDNLKVESLYLDMVLTAWDEISSPTGLVYIELTAPNGSIFKGSDTFRFLLLPPQEKDIVINVFSGRGDMQSAGGGEVSSGEVGIIIVKTEYAVEVRNTVEGPVREFTVFEGEVTLKTPAPKFVFGGSRLFLLRSKMYDAKVSTGQKLIVNDTINQRLPTQIEVVDVAKSAAVYARIDTAKATMRKQVDAKETYTNLLARYLAVFGDPTNPGNRIQLAIDQVNLDINYDALYQLKKAEQFTPPEQNKTRAIIALTKGVAFSQTGETEAATREIQKARLFDAAILDDNNMGALRFNDKIRANIREHKLTGGPLRDDGSVKPTAWPIPQNLTSQQQEIFKLIQAGSFREAQGALEKSPIRLGGQLSSIDAYANAIIFYELKDPKSAQYAAGLALQQSSTDKLLSKEIYASTKKILEVTNQAPKQ